MENIEMKNKTVIIYCLVFFFCKLSLDNRNYLHRAKYFMFPNNSNNNKNDNYVKLILSQIKIIFLSKCMETFFCTFFILFIHSKHS